MTQQRQHRNLHPMPHLLAPRVTSNRQYGESIFADYRKYENDSRHDLNPLKPINREAQAIAIGCSITASYYLEEGFSWPRIVELFSGQTMNVCAASGSSIMLQAHLFTDILTTIKRPLHIYGLFPDLERFIGPSVSAPHFEPSSVNYIWMPQISAYILPSDLPTFFQALEGKKRAARVRAATFTDFQNAKYIFPAELGIHQSLIGLEVINNTSTLLKANKHWFSWCSYTQATLEEMKIPSLITSSDRDHPLTLESAEKDNGICTRHRPTNLKQKNVWRVAHDNWHPGLHAHIHFAETFLGFALTDDHTERINP